MTIVRCNQLRPSGTPCNILFPNANPKHSGPCSYCCRDMISRGRIDQLKKELAKSQIPR